MATKPQVKAPLDEEALNNLASQRRPGPAAAPQGDEPQEALDPEAMNEQEMADTGDAEGPGEDQQDPNEDAEEGEGAARDATPEEQKMFDTMGRQALELLTSDAGARTLYRLAQSVGPEKALAQVISSTFEGVEQAAMGAGVKLPEALKPAVAQPVVMAMCALLAKGGLVKDPQTTAQSVMQLLAQPEPEDQPGQA